MEKGIKKFEGSPPRVRELPVTQELIQDDLGITPACAGITPKAF